jgi:hypothetical protein
VALYENEWGIVAAGAMRSDVTPEQARRLRGSDISPDWRKVNGRLEVVGLLAVNVSGFIVEGLAASAGRPVARGLWNSTTDEVEALVACGMVHHETSAVDALRSRLEELEGVVASLNEAVRPIRAERARARLATMTLKATKASEDVETLQEEEETDPSPQLESCCGKDACVCAA